MNEETKTTAEAQAQNTNAVPPEPPETDTVKHRVWHDINKRVSMYLRHIEHLQSLQRRVVELDDELVGALQYYFQKESQSDPFGCLARYEEVPF